MNMIVWGTYCLTFSTIDPTMPGASGQCAPLGGINLPLSGQALEVNDVQRSRIHGPLASYVGLSDMT